MRPVGYFSRNYLEGCSAGSRPNNIHSTTRTLRMERN